MNILLITFSDNSDHQDTLFGLYEELRKENKISLLCIDNPKAKIDVDKNVKMVNCPKRPGITLKTFDLFALWKIINWIKKEKFDCIYFESLHIWNLPIMFLLKNKAKIYHVIHEVIPHEGDKHEKMLKYMNKTIVKYSDKVVLRNEKYKKVLIENYNISKDNVIFLELWRRFPEYSEFKNSKKMLFFGRINKYKGIENLIKLIEWNSDIEFYVVGRVDESMKDLAEKISSFKNVTTDYNYVSNEQMKFYFNNSDWIILPYSSASQSGVIIDSYKYSRPVISFDVGAIYEQIENGKTGYLIEEGNLIKFSNQLREVWNFRNKNEIFCKNAYDFGIKKYSSKYGAQCFVEMLKNTNIN